MGTHNSNNSSRINLRTYCKAFMAFGNNPDTGRPYAAEICQRLNPTWESAGDEVSIYREDAGDGKILVPEFRQIGGKWQPYKWNELDWSMYHVANHFREAATYFIAGAFGAEEIPLERSGVKSIRYGDGKERARHFFRDDLDSSLVSGLKKLYGICLKDETDPSKSCGDSAIAIDVGGMWTKISAQRKEESRQAKEVSDLRQKYAALEAQIEKKSELSKMAAYQLSLPATVSTDDDYRKAKYTLEKMIETAEAIIREESSARAEALTAARQKQLQIETAAIKEYTEKIAAKIEEEVPWPYSRFTDALKYGFDCIPLSAGMSIEAQHDAAQRRRDIAIKIHFELTDYPKHKTCHTTTRDKCYRGEFCHQVEETSCHSEVPDADKLMAIVKGYCTTNVAVSGR